LSPNNAESLLTVQELSLSYVSGDSRTSIIHSLSFSIGAGEVVGLLGESGSGKTSLALAILGLLPSNARIESGSIRLRGRELMGLKEGELQSVRGKEISLIFQEPAIALNPVMRLGTQIVEVLRAHYPWSGRRCREEAMAMLEQVRLSNAAEIYSAYPHQLSGGQRQRVAIAQALICKPALVIADEPTASLDTTIQADILALLKQLQQQLSLSFLFISHNPAILQKMAQRILVINAGQIVEEGPASQVLARPQHPYTRRLLECVSAAPGGVRKMGADAKTAVSSSRPE
jgi:ABC-type glutathione transport system ATPase component